LLPTANKATLERLLCESSFCHGCKPEDPFPRFRAAGPIRETGGAYLAVDYVEGTSVDRALSKLGFTRKIRLFMDILTTLAAVHNHGYVYGNIHPRHFIVRSDGSIRLVDFFHVRKNGDFGVGVGLPGYQAPEQISGAEPLSGRTDVFVAAMWMFYALFKKWPYPGRKLLSPRYRLRKPSTYSAYVTPALNEILITALSRDASKRYANAGEMGDVLWRSFGASTVIDDFGVPFESRLRVAASDVVRLTGVILYPLRTVALFLFFLLLRLGPVAKVLVGSTAVLGIAGIVMGSLLQHSSSAPAMAEKMQEPKERREAGSSRPSPKWDLSKFSWLRREPVPPVPPPKPASCHIKFFTWPATRVSVGGTNLCEAPNPSDYAVEPGNSLIHFCRKDGKGCREVSLRGLVPGKHYALRFNLDDGKTVLEEE
jgi:serine/threonine protein kinase